MQKQKSFTLIEILVVIGIIGLLAAVILISLNAVRVSARDSKRLTDMKQIQSALELYYDENTSYPGIDDQWFDIDGCNASYTDLSTVLGTNYISAVPKDPLAGRCNWYQNKNDGEGYILMFQPEDSDLLDEDENCYLPATWYCFGLNWQ